jgi:hypothetical protein
MRQVKLLLPSNAGRNVVELNPNDDIASHNANEKDGDRKSGNVKYDTMTKQLPKIDNPEHMSITTDNIAVADMYVPIGDINKVDR